MTRSSFVILTILGFSSGDAAVRAQTIYWTDEAEGTIKRIDVQGGAIETLVTGLDLPHGIALDLDNNKMYWAEPGIFDPDKRKIRRANLDGTQVEDVVTTGFLPLDKWEFYPWVDTIALDTKNGKIYWGAGIIQRANLDGSDVENVTSETGPFGPWVVDLELDLAAGKLYFIWESDCIPCSGIRTASLEDSGAQFLSVDAGYAVGLALDALAGKIYWIDWAWFPDPPHIRRANLDGSNEEILITGALGSHRSIVVDPLGRRIYWMELDTGRLRSANLDGSNVQTLVTTGTTFPSGIALVPGKPIPALAEWGLGI